MFVYFSSLKRGKSVKNLDMKKFAFFSDLIFSFFVSFLFSIFLFRYLRVPLLPAFLLACLCGILTAAAVGAILQIKRKNLYLKKSDETQKEKLLLHLALLSDEAKTQFFKQALSTETHEANRFGRLRLSTKTDFYFLKFSLAPVCADEVASLSRVKTSKQKIVLCAQIEESAFALCNRLGIEVKTGENVYKLLKERNLLPQEYLGDQPVKKTKRRVKLWFSKNNARRFLVGGGLVLLMSRLTPFYYYYLLFGVLLLLGSVLVRIFGYE